MLICESLIKFIFNLPIFPFIIAMLQTYWYQCYCVCMNGCTLAVPFKLQEDSCFLFLSFVRSFFLSFVRSFVLSFFQILMHEVYGEQSDSKSYITEYLNYWTGDHGNIFRLMGVESTPDGLAWYSEEAPLRSAGTQSIWAAARQNQQNHLCPQRRLRSAWASAQSDQNLRYPHEEA